MRNLPLSATSVLTMTILMTMVAVVPPKHVWAGDEPMVQSYLASGKLADGAAALKKRLERAPDDDEARFSLGIVQFLLTVESFGQSQHKYGFLQHRIRRGAFFFRLPIPTNDKPEEISYKKARAIIQDLLDQLETVEATLAKVDTTNVKVPLHFGRIRLDLDSDGKATDEETFWRIFAAFDGRVNEEMGKTFRIAFDGGDVHWLRGYCHVLMSVCEVALAHDWQELFERTGHLLYPRVKSPHKFLAAEEIELPVRRFDWRFFADIIAYIHLINFEVDEPERMKKALDHLHVVVRQSRASWTRILSETDDDNEWLPGPDQKGVIPGVRIRKELIDDWHGVLDEAESVLRGQKLLPFWRGYKTNPEEIFTQRSGINLKRVFTEPKRFDMVMWVSGTAATPFLEEGELTKRDTWINLTRNFGRNFFGFAIWFN